MNNLLLISIFVSVVLNIALFMYLFRNKKGIEQQNSFTQCSENEPKHFEEALEREIHKVERYEDYSFCVASIELKNYPEDVLDTIRAFFRKSDAVYLLYNKIYILFPFLQFNEQFEHKIKIDLVKKLKENYTDIEPINVYIQECSIYEMIKAEDIMNG